MKSQSIVQTPPANSSLSQEEKIKKLRQHNKALKSRVNHLIDQLSRLELTQLSDCSKPTHAAGGVGRTTASTVPCQIEVSMCEDVLMFALINLPFIPKTEVTY